MAARGRWRAIFWLGSALSALFVASSIAAGPLREAFFSADNVYIPTLFADLTRWQGHIADWNLTPAPYFFPDMLLYGAAWLLTKLTHSPLEAAQYLTACLQVVLILLVARELLRRALPDRADASALIAPVFVAWFMLLYVDGGAVVGPALEVSSHGGALLISFAVFTLCLRPQSPARLGGTPAVAVLSALAGGSDPLFTVSCSAVLGLCALALARAHWRARKTKREPAAPVLLSRCCVAALFGAGGTLLARELGLAAASSVQPRPELALANALKLWSEDDLVVKTTLVVLALVTILAGVTILTSRRNPARAGLRVLAWWQMSTTGAVIGAVLYTAAYGDRYTLRYLIVPCHLGVVFITALLARQLGAPDAPGRTNPGPTRIAVSLTLAGFIGLAANLSNLITASYASSKRNGAECVRQIGAREGVKTIVSDYWFAKPLMLLTDDRAHVVQVRRGLQPYFWINSRGWYRDPQEFGIVIMNMLDPHRAIKILGEPQSIERCDDLELFIYRGTARARMNRRLKSMFAGKLAEATASKK